MRAYLWIHIFLIALFGAAFAALPEAYAETNPSVTMDTRGVSGDVVSVITADLNDPTVKVEIGLPARGLSHGESFGGFIARHSPIAAVTGTYFDLRTLLPTGSIVVEGKMIYESHIGTAVCFTHDNKTKFIDARAGESCDMSCAQCAVRTGPRLLANGRYALDPQREGFRHPGLFGSHTRMAMGVTTHNKLLLVFVRTPVTFARTAAIMKALGAVDAACLDGGTSSAMYYAGRFVHHPGRMLTNVIEIVRRPLPIFETKTAITPVAKPELGGSQYSGRPAETQQEAGCEHVVALADPIKLRFAKGFHARFPVNRAKFTGLQGLDHS